MMYFPTDTIWVVAKLFFLFALVIYMIFATVVVKQIYQMIQTVQMGFEFPVKMLGWIHLFIAIAVFLFALFTL